MQLNKAKLIHHHHKGQAANCVDQTHLRIGEMMTKAMKILR